MLTPQQLMDLPGYGAAERKLREEGRWQLTPEEKRGKASLIAMITLAAALEDASDAIRNADDAIDDALKEYRTLAKEAQCN